MQPYAQRHSLAAQMMIRLAALALLAALAVGLPAIWLVRAQLQQQAWQQVQQGEQASRALVAAQRKEVAGLATLIAERPTLAALLQQADTEPLQGYLATLRSGADLDLVVVCEQGAPLAQTTDPPLTAATLALFCQKPAAVSLLVVPATAVSAEVWLAATEPLAINTQTVVVARHLDEAYTAEMRAETGLEHSLLVDGTIVASSLPAATSRSQSSQAARQFRFTVQGQPFYAHRFTLTSPEETPSVTEETALSVANVITTQRRLLRILLGSMALATVLGLALAALLARRISHPLAALAGSASALRGGQLDTPLAFDTNVREVAVLGQALEAARVDLQRTLAELRREKALTEHFLANVSHEFRTPLTAIAASVELLIDQAAALTPSELQELLATLHLGVLNLHKLVDNLLESANIEAGRFRVRPRSASLATIIADAAATMQPLLDRHGQRLVVELPAAMPVVQADHRRVVQVLVNLLSNASTAQRGLPDMANGQITLRAHSEPDGRWVRVLVADQGPGIPPAQRAHLLRGQRFSPSANQADADAPGGFGLGLSVVKAIVAGHGGAWGIETASGGGAVVWFTLPRAADEPEEERT